MMGFRILKLRKTQNGSALIVSLLFLIVLTMLGLVGMQTTTMEEKMAGNTRDQYLAFQSAESGLRDAELFLENVVTTAAFNGTNGLYSADDAEPNYFSDSPWTNARLGNAVAGTAERPRFIIQHIVDIEDNSKRSLNIGGYGKRNTGDITAFRITVRGTGGSDTAHVYLQSHYGRRL